MEILLAVLALAAIALLALVIVRSAAQSREVKQLNEGLAQVSQRLSEALEARHRGMLTDLHSGLTQQGDRLGGHLTESSERLRGAVANELKETRDTVHALKLSLSESMNEYREAMMTRLNETT